jgi:hypothetical protein
MSSTASNRAKVQGFIPGNPWESSLGIPYTLLFEWHTKKTYSLSSNYQAQKLGKSTDQKLTRLLASLFDEPRMKRLCYLNMLVLAWPIHTSQNAGCAPGVLFSGSSSMARSKVPSYSCAWKAVRQAKNPVVSVHGACNHLITRSNQVAQACVVR